MSYERQQGERIVIVLFQVNYGIAARTSHLSFYICEKLE